MPTPLTTAAAAAQLGLTASVLGRYIRAGRLRAARDTWGYYRIDAAEIKRFAAIPRPRTGRPAKNKSG